MGFRPYLPKSNRLSTQISTWANGESTKDMEKTTGFLGLEVDTWRPAASSSEMGAFFRCPFPLLGDLVVFRKHRLRTTAANRPTHPHPLHRRSHCTRSPKRVHESTPPPPTKKRAAAFLIISSQPALPPPPQKEEEEQKNASTHLRGMARFARKSTQASEARRRSGRTPPSPPGPGETGLEGPSRGGFGWSEGRKAEALGANYWWARNPEIAPLGNQG